MGGRHLPVIVVMLFVSAALGGCISDEEPNKPPKAFAGEDVDAEVGERVIFSGTGLDDDGSIVEYRWDYDGDGNWDNNRESVVIVDTILPSRWDENAAEHDEDWIRENSVHVEDGNLKVGPGYGTIVSRTLHRTTLTYYYNPTNTYPRRILVLDEIVEGA